MERASLSQDEVQSTRLRPGVFTQTRQHADPKALALRPNIESEFTGVFGGQNSNSSERLTRAVQCSSHVNGKNS